jgi:hypothetical protein
MAIVSAMDPEDGQAVVDEYRELWRHAIRGYGSAKQKDILLDVMRERSRLPLPEYSLMLDTSWIAWLQALENRWRRESSVYELLMRAKETVALELIADEVYKARFREELHTPEPVYPPPEPRPDDLHSVVPPARSAPKLSHCT